MPYQLNSSKLFLTYPQCTISKEDALEYLLTKFESYIVNEYLVAHELHANGDHHLHCFLGLSTAIRTRDSHFADLPGGYHGNYQGCRSAKNVIKYCTKSDDYVGNIDVSSKTGPSARKRVCQDLVTNKRTLVEAIGDNPEFLIGYTKLKMDLANYNKDLEDKRMPLPNWLPNPWGKVLLSNRPSKRRHYWIYSDHPNLGKTYHFARPLVEQYRVHIRTGNEPYWDLRGDEQAVIIDEYNSAMFKYHQLNALADGHFEFRVFMAGTVRLKYPLIVILSNVSISTLYPNMNEFLYARFNEIKLD